ncbi:YdcF family protein [Pseudomonas turukhanskensis]|uniref:Membrane protein n=1 Tax=Pseudomonas turukhanskensis TaxID=1806536 RepID=A0A9W6K9D2_9PSED|nr:YdcF family protein [Pseudomonas turukhanskensis]GLK91846.1 membrane protein [Pseudomonas turukhanskensis]
MVLRYFFKQLLLLPGCLFLLLLLAWFLRRRMPRLAACCFAVGLGGLWLSSAPVAVEQLARLVEREPALAHQQWAGLATQADAIVVLGAGRERDDPAWGGDQASQLAVERLRYAARLAKASGLPVLISGGSPFGEPVSEAALMADVMSQDFGVPVRWQEGQSKTTWENAQLSASILHAAGIQRVVLVTQAAHMPRSRWCFEQAGLQVVSAPVGFISVPNQRPLGGWLPESKSVWQTGLLLNEVAGQIAYPLFYR